MRELAEKNEKADAQRRATMEAQAEQERRAERRQETERQKRLVAQEEQDRQEGYKRMGILDFLVDFQKIPEGEKVIITGLHSSVGQIDALSDGGYSGKQIYLAMDGLSRETRKRIMQCHQRSVYCRMTIWAHAGCSVSFVGHKSDVPCLVVDGVRGGTYENPHGAAILH